MLGWHKYSVREHLCKKPCVDEASKESRRTSRVPPHHRQPKVYLPLLPSDKCPGCWDIPQTYEAEKPNGRIKAWLRERPKIKALQVRSGTD